MIFLLWANILGLLYNISQSLFYKGHMLQRHYLQADFGWQSPPCSSIYLYCGYKLRNADITSQKRKKEKRKKYWYKIARQLRTPIGDYTMHIHPDCSLILRHFIWIEKKRKRMMKNKSNVFFSYFCPSIFIFLDVFK